MVALDELASAISNPELHFDLHLPVLDAVLEMTDGGVDDVGQELGFAIQELRSP